MKKTGAEGKNAKEGIKINLSLTKLALTVKCLAEGSKHIPFRESKLTMMLAKGLGGNNMLHIVLALSNSKEQVSEGTACLRFGQSCLSMTVNPNANKLEKEQAEMKAVIKEQMQEISDLQVGQINAQRPQATGPSDLSLDLWHLRVRIAFPRAQRENEELKEAMEKIKHDASDHAMPDLFTAKHIEVNKEALQDDINDAIEQIEELRRALEEKKKDALSIGADDHGADASEQLSDDDALLADMEPQQRAEAMEARRRELMVAKMKRVAENEQEQKAIESEMNQLLEIQSKLETRLSEADARKAAEEERIRADVEEKAAEERREIEDQAAETVAALRAAEAESKGRHEEMQRREKELQEELARKEETMRQEEALREQMSAASEEENAVLKHKMETLQRERQEQDTEIERARQEQAHAQQLQAEAHAAIEAKQKQEKELAVLQDKIEQMERESAVRGRRAKTGSRHPSACVLIHVLCWTCVGAGTCG